MNHFISDFKHKNFKIFYFRACPILNACPGSSIEQDYCNDQLCSGSVSVGTWSLWSAWGPCSVPCGVGVKRRTRHCQGGSCVGSLRESVVCNVGSCSAATASWGGEEESLEHTTVSGSLESLSGVSGSLDRVQNVNPPVPPTVTLELPIIASESITVTVPETSTVATTTTTVPTTNSGPLQWRLASVTDDPNSKPILRWTLASSSRDEILGSDSVSNGNLGSKVVSHPTASGSPRFSFITGKGLSSARSVNLSEFNRLRFRS